MQLSREFRAAFAVLIAGVVAGCAVPDVSPKLHMFDRATAGLNGPDVAPAEAWWLGLDDRQLDAIMTSALAGNPTLDEALARLRVATAGVAAEGAGLQPQIAIDAQEQPSRLSGAFTIPPPYAGSDRWVGSLQTNLSWALDFAGRQRALISQARGGAEAAAFDVAAARIVLTGAVAQTYVALARAEQQTRIAEDLVHSRQEGLALARVRSANHLVSDFDLRAGETLLAQAQQSLDTTKEDRALATHALAVVAGRGADDYSAIASPSLRFDAALPLPASLPANLLDRRPDILAARARIAAAGAQRRAARADFYPSVDLRAFLGVSSINLNTLLTAKALAYGVGPAIHAPVFEGGELRAQYDAATAGVDAATASYNRLALRAIQETSDALTAIDANAAEAADQRKIVVGLAETVFLDQTRRRTGLGTQLDVLGSGDRLLQARQSQIDLDAEGLASRVQLLVAVGGDFNPKIPGKVAVAADGGPSTGTRP